MSMSAAIERYKDLSKTEVVERLASMSTRARGALVRHKETIRHAGFTAMGQGAAFGTGFVLGLIEKKAPGLRTIPRTQVPTASAAGLLLSAVNLARVFGDATPIVQSMADVATGEGGRQVALRVIK